MTEDLRYALARDPNDIEDPEHIVHLVEKVVTISVETVHLVKK